MTTDAMTPPPAADDRVFGTLHEFVAAARARLDDRIWGYLVGGSDTETTLARNRQALDSLALRARILRDVSRIDLGARFLGKPSRLPVGLAPVGSLDAFWPEGAFAAAQAASEFGLPFFVSSVKLEMMEPMAAHCTGPKVYQLYPRGDADWIDAQIARVIAAGYDAVCFTVDNAVSSRRERDISQGFERPWKKAAKGTEFQASFTWSDLERVKKTHDIPVMLKGVNTGEDAARACAAGVDVVYVSNHGGRQLDHGPGMIEVLPEVLAAVNGRVPVIVDGGFCRGTDIVKAMALGASFVNIGRMYLFAVAAGGKAGVLQMLDILEREIEIAMGLLGCRTWDDLTPALVQPARPVTTPHVFSAFPLLALDSPARRPG